MRISSFFDFLTFSVKSIVFESRGVLQKYRKPTDIDCLKEDWLNLVEIWLQEYKRYENDAFFKDFEEEELIDEITEVYGSSQGINGAEKGHNI